MQIKEITVNGKKYLAFEDEIAPETKLVYIKRFKRIYYVRFLNLKPQKKGNIAAL